MNNVSRQRTVLITGATDGIGLALAKRLQARGDRLILVGRRPVMSFDLPLLQEALYCQADLTRADSADTVLAFLQSIGVDRLDLLVNNAGAGYFGALQDADTDTIHQLAQLNLFASVRLTYRLLPLLEAARGRVCFVSSVVSTVPASRYAVYAATKAALEGFARSLRVELAGRVSVQVVRPGATRTGMHQKMGISLQEMPWDRFPDAKETARMLEKALAKGRDCSLGWANGLIWVVGRYFPQLLDRARLRSENPVNALSTVNTGGKRCLITGAAQGIGLAFGHVLARDGYYVVGIDVDEEALEAAVESVSSRGYSMLGLKVDLRNPATFSAIAEDVAQHGPYDLVVHCAGISAVGRFGALPLAAQEAVLAVNFLGPLQLSTLLLQWGGYSPQSKTIFVASLSCYASYPGACAYAASKDGLASFARGFRLALGSAHTVTTVYPGPVNTSHAARYSPDNSRADRRMAPEKVVEAALHGVRRGKPQVVPGWANRSAALLGHWAPLLVERMMRGVIYDKIEDTIRIHKPSGSTNLAEAETVTDDCPSDYDKEYDRP